MAGRKAHVSAGFGRLPGAVRTGSNAFHNRNAMLEGRAGMAAIISQYEAFIKQMKGMTPDVLRNAMQPVFDKSQEYVPKKTGELAASGKLTVGAGPRLEANITYGNATAWYAAVIHEHVWLNHEPPTRAKYLQSAMEEELDSFLVSIAIDYGVIFK